MSVRLVASLCTLVLLSACASSRSASDGYAIAEREGGGLEIVLADTSQQTLMRALADAADQVAWKPPDSAGPLRLRMTKRLTPVDRVYDYDVPAGVFNVYVYLSDFTVDEQVSQTHAALREQITQGRLEFLHQTERTQRDIPWRDTTATLHRIVYAQIKAGEDWASAMYLLQDEDGHWIKVRVSYPAEAMDPENVDTWVLDLLEG